MDQSDIIQIIRTRNVSFLSGPSGMAVNPNGNWIIVGFVGDEVIACKDGTIIRIPSKDVKLVARSSLDILKEKLKNAGKVNRDIDVLNKISSDMGWHVSKVKRLMKVYNIPSMVPDLVTYNNLRDKLVSIVNSNGEDVW